MGEQFGDRMHGGMRVSDRGTTLDNGGVLDSSTIPETAHTISPTPRPIGVPPEDSNEWLLPSQRQAPEVQRLLHALEQRLRAEVLRVQQRADLQLRELDHRLTAQIAARARRLDALDASGGQGSSRPACDEGDRRMQSLEREGDDLRDRLRQTGLALVNFNERITAMESKVATPSCSPARSLGASSPMPSLGERLPSSGSGLLPSTGSSLSGKDAQDLRAEVAERIDRERCERVAGTEEVRQFAQENRAKIVETKEQLSLFAKRLKGQELDHEDLREMQERFFLDARTALAASVSVSPVCLGSSRSPGFDGQVEDVGSGRLPRGPGRF